MKSIAKTMMFLQLTALCLTAALAGGAAKEKEKSFHGRLQAVETYDTQFPSLVVESVGSAHASHLGCFSTYSLSFINLLDGSGSGSGTWVAANGDTLVMTGSGQFTPTEDPDIALIVELVTITGGTGRFAGASGSFTIERLLNTVTGVTSGSFEGTIVTQKSKHRRK
jgi:hypothetical protein